MVIPGRGVISPRCQHQAPREAACRGGGRSPVSGCFTENAGSQRRSLPWAPLRGPAPRWGRGLRKHPRATTGRWWRPAWEEKGLSLRPYVHVCLQPNDCRTREAGRFRSTLQTLSVCASSTPKVLVCSLEKQGISRHSEMRAHAVVT